MTRASIQVAFARTLWGGAWLLLAGVVACLLPRLWQLPWPAEAGAFEHGLWTAAGILVAGPHRFRPLMRYLGAFAHEHTHAVAGGYSGARVHEIVVGEGWGHVTLSKTNAFIALAPYGVPLFALLAASLIPFVPAPYGVCPAYAAGLLYLLFLEDTLQALTVGQPDIRDLQATVFATSAIVASNLVSLVALAALVLHCGWAALGTLTLAALQQCGGTLTRLLGVA